MKVSPGDIVYALAGRDKGRCFAVTEVFDGFVYICDGRRRKADKPKLKKVKHLKLGCGHSDYIADKLSSGNKITNAELRRELKPYLKP